MMGATVQLGWSWVVPVIVAALAGLGAAGAAWWLSRRRPRPCGPRKCHSPTACLAPRCYGRLRYGPAPDPSPPAAGLDADSERIWDALERPRLPYPRWYRPEQDRAAQLGQVQHGSGAARYFARNMHDHRRGPAHCPVCQGQS